MSNSKTLHDLLEQKLTRRVFASVIEGHRGDVRLSLQLIAISSNLGQLSIHFRKV